jgi:hypothetical protein
MAFWTSALACPSKSASASLVALFRAPLGLSAGLGTKPFVNVPAKKMSANPRQAKAKGQGRDLSNEDEIVWMRDKPIGAVRHKGRDRKDGDARGPARAERHESPNRRAWRDRKTASQAGLIIRVDWACISTVAG